MAVFSRISEMTCPKKGIVGRRTGGSLALTEGKTTRLRRSSARGSAAMAVSIPDVRPDAVSDEKGMSVPNASASSCDILSVSGVAKGRFAALVLHREKQ